MRYRTPGERAPATDRPLPAVCSVISGAMTPHQTTADAAAGWIPTEADPAALD